MTIVDTVPNEVKISYEPKPKQIEFHSLEGKYRAFGGGWGNGKTTAGVVECVAMALEYPGCTGLMARKTRPELKATTQDVLFNGGHGPPGDWEGLPQELIRTFNKTEQKLTLVNGSVIHFWPLDDPKKLTNMNLGWFMIDQAEEVTEEMFQMLQGRLRQDKSPRKGIVLFNPEGHNWIWRRWVYLQYPDHKIVEAKTTDNDSLPPDYLASLMAMPERWRKRFVEGSYDVFEGQIYPEFDEETHTLNPFMIQEWFEVVEAIDHGRRNPTAILWLAFDDVGNCFIVDEHYLADRLVSYHAKEIIKRREHWGEPEYAVIDASAAQEDPNTGRSVIDEYNDYGVFPEKSDRHVMARINRMAEWMALDPNHPHPLTGETCEEGYPHLWVFKNCVNLIEHLPQYRWRPKPPTSEEDPKEKPREKDDHDVDALGYGLMTRPEGGHKPHGQQEEGPDDWYWKRVRDRMDGKAQKGHSKLGVDA